MHEKGFDEMTDCPQCGGTGTIVPGATCGMWGGLAPWPEDLVAEPCDLCDGQGEVPEEVAAEYEAQWSPEPLAPLDDPRFYHIGPGWAREDNPIWTDAWPLGPSPRGEA